MDRPNEHLAQAQAHLATEEAHMQLQHRRLRHWQAKSRHWWNSSICKQAAREAQILTVCAEERVSAAKFALQRVRQQDS